MGAARRLAQSALLLCLLFAATACSGTNNERAAEPLAAPSADAPPWRILALGDSYTIGESVGADHRWPNYLQRRLVSEGFQTEKPEIIAKTGWTSQQLRLAMKDQQSISPYDWVTLMIGVNDQYIGREPERFAVDFDALLNKATQLAGGNSQRVVVLSIPDWGVSRVQRNVNRAKISAQIASFNEVVADKTEAKNALFVDITDFVEMARNDSQYIANDGLHFSGEMHKLWAYRVAERIMAESKAAAK